MLDVHAPHESVHNIKDAAIHIVIITIGLLIAVGIEQTVEWVHHLHQRHQLEADLHAEAVRNLDLINKQYEVMDASIATMSANIDSANAMIASRGKAKLKYKPLKSKILTPLASAWTTAKESDLIGLLPRDEEKFYDRIYRQYDFLMDALNHSTQSRLEVMEFNAQFADHSGQPTIYIVPDLSRMSVDDLREEVKLLNRSWADAQYVRFRFDSFYTGESAVASGAVQSDADVVSNVVPRPKTVQPAEDAGVNGAAGSAQKH